MHVIGGKYFDGPNVCQIRRTSIHKRFSIYYMQNGDSMNSYYRRKTGLLDCICGSIGFNGSTCMLIADIHDLMQISTALQLDNDSDSAALMELNLPLRLERSEV